MLGHSPHWDLSIAQLGVVTSRPKIDSDDEHSLVQAQFLDDSWLALELATANRPRHATSSCWFRRRRDIVREESKVCFDCLRGLGTQREDRQRVGDE